MDPINVSISFNEVTFPEIKGTSGIKIDENYVLTSGILQSTISSKNKDFDDFILSLEPGKLAKIPKNTKLPPVTVKFTSRTQSTSQDSRINESTGRILGAWCCPLLNDTIDNLFVSWSLTENSQKLKKQLLTIFLIIKLDCSCNDDGIEIMEKSLNHLLVICKRRLEAPGRGAVMVIESTPFGNSVFIDSISRGIVSNVVGTNDCILLTDASSVPGCEGGPAYVIENDGGNKLLCGMVIAPLSWCRGEWVHYTLVARLLPCLTRLLHSKNRINSLAVSNDTKFTEQLDKSVVLVRCGTEWGSGIVLDRATGTVLTCSHVVSEAPEKQIRVVLRSNDARKNSGILGVWAELVYRTPIGLPYDVAILKINTKIMDSALRPFKIAGKPAKKGEIVISAGFPFFSSTLPTLTRGNISRVSKCMLQTTCCVHSGASGGPVVRAATGELLGMVVCNIMTSRRLYPRLNMAVPIDAIEGPIFRYIETGSINELTALENPENAVHEAWNFHLTSKI